MKRSNTTMNAIKHHALRRVIVVLIFLMTGAQGFTMLAQGFGSVQGVVSDPSGAVVANGVVTAVQTQTGSATVVNTNQSGNYVFPSLPPAEYSISVSAPSFQKYVRSGIILQADQSVTVNFALRPGEESQAVTVNADSEQVNTSTATLSEVIDTRRVNDLPLNGRNAAQLTELVAGVVLAPNDSADQGQTKTFPVAVTISANGSRANQTTYMLNGGNNLDEYTNVNQPFPFPDALQEFSVQTSNYDAEYGLNSGPVVNIVTKSGGQDFHGDVFEYLRNGVFNARNYFASSVDPLKRNQFGGTFGGPLVIPHVMNAKHTFFFFGVQKTIIHDVQGGLNTYVPTQANLQGDFSALESSTNPANPLQKATQIDDRNGHPYNNNQIPVSSFDPAAVAFAAALPKATGNGQIFYSQPIRQSYLEFLGRVDQDLGANDHLFAHYYTNEFTNGGVLDLINLLTYADQANIRVQSALVSETHTFNANIFNNIVLNYSREISVRGPLPGAPNVGSYGVNIYQPTSKSLQQVTATGFFKIGDNPQATFQRNNYTLADDFHWVHGNHNIAFGAHAELSKVDINSLDEESGLFTFNSNTTNYALASFLLGYMYQFTQGSGQYFNDRNHFLGFYGQDSWKLSKRLTVNYGIRYEPYYPWQEIQHRIEQFSPSAYAAGQVSTVYTNAPRGLFFPGDPGVPEQGIRSVFTDVMPRVGFALDVFGDGKTSLRGGGGLFYDTRGPASDNVAFTNVTPFSTAVQLTTPAGSFSNPYLGTTDPFPVPSPAPKNIVFPSPVLVYMYAPSGNYQVPLTYNWNLAIEQQLTSSMLSRISYVASHSSHMTLDNELNPSTYMPGSTLTTDQRRKYLGYSNISAGNQGGNQSYESLQASLQQRFAHHFTFLLNYTFSKSLDTLPYGTSSDAHVANQSYTYPIYSPNYKALDIGPSDFDTRNVLSASYVVDLPKLASGNGILRGVVNGWRTSGAIQAHSGTPVTVIAGKDQSGTALMQDRAVYSGANAYGPGACTDPTKYCKNWLVPGAFSLPAAGTFGNVTKGTFRTPSYVDWDAALFRDLPIRNDLHGEFRAEYFDLLNSPNFESPVNSVSGAGFGSITAAYTSRIAQLSLKVVF